MLAAFAALKDLDHVVVVDDDIDLHDGQEVEYAVATRVEASRDVFMIPGARGHEYVRVSDRGQRTKVGIDATVPFDERGAVRAEHRSLRSASAPATRRRSTRRGSDDRVNRELLMVGAVIVRE